MSQTSVIDSLVSQQQWNTLTAEGFEVVFKSDILAWVKIPATRAIMLKSDMVEFKSGSTTISIIPASMIAQIFGFAKAGDKIKFRMDFD